MKLLKEQESRDERKEHFTKILENFNKDDLINHLQQEIQEDEVRLQRFNDVFEQMTEQAVAQQKLYLGFEKQFFFQLEQISIERKQ